MLSAPTSSYWMIGCFLSSQLHWKSMRQDHSSRFGTPSPSVWHLYTNNKIDLKYGSSWRNWYKARISFDIRILVVVCDNTHSLCAFYGLRDGNTRPPDLPPEKSVCSQEATVRTRHGTMDWFKTGKGVRQGCILSPCLFNFYAEYIMRNARLDEAQAGIKTAGEISITSDMQMTSPLWQKAKKN